MPESDLERFCKEGAFFKFLFENTSTGVLVRILTGDPHTETFVMANAAASRLTGISEEQLVCFTPADLFASPNVVFMPQGEFVNAEIRHSSGKCVPVQIATDIYQEECRAYAISLLRPVDATGPALLEAVQANLRESQERLELAQKAGKVGVFDLDIPTGRAVWTEQLEELFGLEPGSFEGNYEGWASRVHPEDRPEIEGRFRQWMSDRQERVEFEYRMIRADGAVRWISAGTRFFYAPDGAPLRMVGTNVDITERKMSEEALQRANQQFRALFETSQAGLALFDAKPPYRVLAHNRWYQEIFPEPYRSQGVMGVPAGELLTQMEETGLAGIFRETAQGAAVGSFTNFYYETVPGEPRWWNWSLQPVVEGGEVAALALVAVDVTREVRALHDLEQALANLQASEAQFRTLANNISQLAWMADGTGWVFWYNQRWFDYTGAAPGEMQGWGWKKVHHPEHVDRVVAKVSRCFETGEVWEDTFPLRGKDGNYRWFLSRAIPIRDQEGKVVRWFGTNTDITQQRETEEALRESEANLRSSNKSLEQFAYAASHDLQEPLRQVSGFVSLLEKKNADKLDDESKEYLTFVKEGALRMHALINDLLEYSRVGRIGKMSPNVDLNTALENAIQNIQGRMDEAHAEVVADPLPVVRGNLMALTQVFQNLLGNSVKFRGPDPLRIEIGARRNNRHWLIWVKDNGIGFPQESAEQIFMLFQRLHGRKDYEGTGIGLTICRRAVEHHGGRIWAESEPGRGATFYFTLPI